MTQIEALFVAFTICNEGMRYGLESKTSFPAITDTVFQGLREDYINNVKGSGKEIKNLIFMEAGIKNFQFKHILSVVDKNFTRKQIDAEEIRWDLAQKRDTELFMARMRAEHEPNNIMKQFLEK